MIIHLDPDCFCCEVQVCKRLQVLERGLRRASDGRMKLSEYASWLERAGLAVPSRQTLRLDLERYIQHCDDLVYGEHQKMIEINVHANRDAIRYFLGEPWLPSPLKPRLSSSVCRCFLLAMHLQAEVEFQYAALPQSGAAPTFKIHRGIPLRTLPGADSGYLAIWEENGQIMHINLARVRGRVAFTGNDSRHYLPPVKDPQIVLSVLCEDPQTLQRLADQFGGLIQGKKLSFAMAQSLALMNADFLEAWLRRTSAAPRQAERKVPLPTGIAEIVVQPEGE